MIRWLAVLFVVASISTPVHAIDPIAQAIVEIRDSPVENLIVFDVFGYVGRSAGSEWEVAAPERSWMFASTVVHNHLSGTIPYFSPGDYYFMHYYNVRTFILVTRLNTGRYKICTATRNMTYWPDDYIQYTIDDFQVVARGKQRMVKAMVKQGIDQFWTNYFSNFKVDYTCEDK